jgi:hypothetical protein
MGVENPTDKLSQFIPEFQFDLIGRITPGLLFCWLYSAIPTIPYMNDKEVIVSFTWLVSAYFAGLLLDVVGTATTSYILNYLCHMKWSVPRYLGLDKWDESAVWEQVDNQTSLPRIVFLKIMAERCLFRGVFTIGVILLIISSYNIYAHDHNMRILSVNLLDEFTIWQMAIGLVVCGIVGYIRMTQHVLFRLPKQPSSEDETPPTAGL